MKKMFEASLILIVLTAITSCTTTTPLMQAAGQGDISTVKDLIDKGADINAESGFGETGLTSYMTPLSYSSWNGQIDAVRLLIDKGANVDASGNQFNMTALSLASYKGHVAVAKLLIDRGADVDIALADCEKRQDFGLFKDGAGLCIKLLTRLRNEAQSTKGKSVSVGAAPFKEVSPIIKSDVDQLPAIKATPNKNSYAIVIGIEQYRQKLPRADHAVNDANVMTEYLTKVMGYPEGNVITLTNEHAAKSDFEKYFEKWLSNNVEKDSSVFIYYSGHGAPNVKTGDAYLVPYDGDPSFIEQTGYPLKRLYESLNTLQVKEIVVVLDSCFSGAGGKSVIAQGARPLVMNLEHDFQIPKNMIVMSASSGDQISSTYEEKGHGLFTYFLLKGIKDGITEVGELFDYLKPNVGRTARKMYNNEQTPQLIARDKQKVFLRN